MLKNQPTKRPNGSGITRSPGLVSISCLLFRIALCKDDCALDKVFSFRLFKLKMLFSFVAIYCSSSSNFT